MSLFLFFLTAANAQKSAQRYYLYAFKIKTGPGSGGRGENTQPC